MYRLFIFYKTLLFPDVVGFGSSDLWSINASMNMAMTDVESLPVSSGIIQITNSSHGGYVKDPW